MIAEQSFECSVETIREVRKWIADTLAGERTPRDIVEGILLAASEAVTNAVVHGYEKSRRGRVDVRIQVAVDSIAITVRDYGTGFGRKPYTPPDTSVPHEGGYGVFLLRNLMDDVKVTTHEDGTEVHMVKALKPGIAS